LSCKELPMYPHIYFIICNISMQIQRTDTQQTQQEWTFEELLKRSSYTLLYFYPKDNTPGCTIESMGFTSRMEEFSSADVQIFWVSRDSHKSHCSFQTKHKLTLPLITDESLELHKKFGARWEKNNYGKLFTWVIRSTFLLDQEWTVLKEWKNVKATWHAERVLSYIKEDFTKA